MSSALSGSGDLIEIVLCVQIVVLVVLYKAVCRVHRHCLAQSSSSAGAAPPSQPVAARSAAAPPAAGASVAAASSAAATAEGTGPIPTVEGLLPEKPAPNWQAAPEDIPLTPEELEVCRKVRCWLGTRRFDTIPRDLLLCFVRGYGNREDWAESVCAFLDGCLRWRQTVDADSCVEADPPPQRQLFEECVQSGVVGTDRHGHPVVVDRIGRIPVDRLLTNFDVDLFIRQQTYNRECLRLYAALNSQKQQKRLYKSIGVLDLKGLGIAHTDRNIFKLLKSQNACFSWYYPESVSKIIVVNAPWLFRGIWSTVKGFLHPITQSKVIILGSDYHKTFSELGIRFDSNEGIDMPRLEGWSSKVQRMLKEPAGQEMLRGYMPEADVEALRQL